MRAACHRSYGKGIFPGGRVNRIKGAKIPGKMKAKVAMDFTTMRSPVTLAIAASGGMVETEASLQCFESTGREELGRVGPTLAVVCLRMGPGEGQQRQRDSKAGHSVLCQIPITSHHGFLCSSQPLVG